MTLEKTTKGGLTWLTEARHNKGLTLKETAQRVGVHPSYLCKMEKGVKRNPSGAVAKSLAALLDIDLDLFWSDVPPDSIKD